MAARDLPICEIFHVPETGCYGFRYRLEGRPPHWEMDVFETLDRCRAWADPHGERVSEAPGDADESLLLISWTYKPGSVVDRRGELRILGQRRDPSVSDGIRQEGL
jgi:hypothetical protein